MRRLALALALPLLLAAAPDEAAGDPAKETVHVVKPGETLGGVANRAVVPRTLIIEANGLKPPYALRAGQKLVIPRRRSHTVAAGETGFSIAYQYGVTWESIATANGIDPKAPVKAGTSLVIPTLSKLPPPLTSPAGGAPPAALAPAKPAIDAADSAPRFAWPAPGKLLRRFVPAGKAGAHSGVDLAGAAGSPVRAAGAGKVIFAGLEPRRFGYLVVIDHGNGWASAYGKLQKVTVKKGDRVSTGERVGLLGNTGETKATELHFELRRGNKPLDPELLLEPR